LLGLYPESSAEVDGHCQVQTIPFLLAYEQVAEFSTRSQHSSVV